MASHPEGYVTESDDDEFNIEGQKALNHILQRSTDSGSEFSVENDFVSDSAQDEFDCYAFKREEDFEASHAPHRTIPNDTSTHMGHQEHQEHQVNDNISEIKFINEETIHEIKPSCVDPLLVETEKNFDLQESNIPNHTAIGHTPANNVLGENRSQCHQVIHECITPAANIMNTVNDDGHSNMDQEKRTSGSKTVLTSIEDARMAWSTVNALRENQGYGKDPVRGFENQKLEEAPINSSDAYTLLQKHPNFQSYVNNETNSEDNPLLTFISRVTLGTCGSVPLRRSLVQEKRELLAVCKIPLDLTEPTHIRMMGTLYKRLTGEKYNCPMVGSHWEHLGFQRPNPQTDLRDAGMFGIVQLLYFVEKGKEVPINLLHLSQTNGIDFPFCVVSLNMTAIAKSLLRSGRLNALINRQKSVREAVNLAYIAIFYDFYLTWKKGDKTIHDYGSIKKELERQSEKKIEKWISRVERNVIYSKFASLPKQEF